MLKVADLMTNEKKEYKKLSDEELVVLAQMENREAMDLVFYRYKESVRGKARMYYMIGSDGEDVIQEGMMGLFKAIQTFDKTKDTLFKTFAEICIQGQIVDAIRGSTRKKHKALNESLSLDFPINNESDKTLADMIKDPDPGLEEKLIQSEEVDLLTKACQHLFSELELEIWTQYLSGKSRREIADRLERSVKSIDNGIQRMKKKVISFMEINDPTLIGKD